MDAPAKEGTDMHEAPPEAPQDRGTEVPKGTDAPVRDALVAEAPKAAEAPDEARGKMPRSIGAVMTAVIGASFGLSFTTWVALAVLSGFNETASVHIGTVTFTVRMAWLLPVVVDGYVVVALLTWMAPVPADVARFAQLNTYATALLGVVTQSAYHGMLGWMSSHNAMIVILTVVVGALSPGLAAGAIHMRTIVIRRSVQPHAATHATHATLPALTTLSPVMPALAVQAPKAPAKPRAPRKAAPAPVQAPDELAPRREHHGDDALLKALHEAWEGTVPSLPGSTRAWVRETLAVGQMRADRLIRRYREEYATPAAEVAQ